MVQPASQPAARHEYQFVAGNLALDFANTADWHESDQPVELLPSFDDLLEWGRQAGTIDRDEADHLRRAAESSPEAAIEAYVRAIELREAVFRIFRGVARQEATQRGDLTILNLELARAFQHRRVVAAPEGHRWDWQPDDASLDRVLWDIALSSAELLTSPDVSRVRQCAGDPCGWLFYDTSRNRSRRWCSMEGCGNRAKARRYYDRQRSGRREVSPAGDGRQS